MPPAAWASASTWGQSAAACCGDRFACVEKLGSLKPSTNCEPPGRVSPRLFWPQIMGTNSIGVPMLEPWEPQLYHHTTPGADAVGASAADGGPPATPRLHGGWPASPCCCMLESPCMGEESGVLVTTSPPPASVGGGGGVLESFALLA